MPNPARTFVNPITPTAHREQRMVVDGYISTAKPAPTKRTEGAWVIVPEHSTSVPIGPCQWSSGNGKAMPKQGALCQVAFGEQEMPGSGPRIVWWEGAYEERVTAVKKPLVITGTTLELESTEAWKKLSTLGYKNAWKDEAATPGEYRKTPFGTVELRGTITGGANETEAFTLPAGYRPTKTEELAVLASLRNIAELNITTAGVVKPVNGPTSAVTTYCTLHAFFSVE